MQFTVRPNLTSPFVGTNYSSRSAEWWDPNLRNPYVMNFNASMQYEFARNYLLDVSYQGSGGVGLIERWQANTFPIDYFAGNPTQQNACARRPRTTGHSRSSAISASGRTSATRLITRAQ